MSDAFAWPIAVVVCFLAFLLIFRQPISNFIGRARRLGYGDKSIDLATEGQSTAVEQQKKPDQSTLAIGSADGSVAHGPPPPNEITAAIEAQILEVMHKENMSASIEKAWLVRTIAALRILHGHAAVYRLITGSQITLILQANTTALPTLEKAQELYEQAKSTYPDIYANFTFETWLNYPINAGLLKIDNDANNKVIRITALGQDFLHYLINNSLTAPKVG